MSAMTSGLRLGRRELAFGLVVAAFLMILTMIPSAAHAAGCTGDTWTNTAGGKWSTGTNWSKKAPPTSEEEACITEKGTYTVELQASETKVKGITVGASSGTQTLAVDTTCSFNSTLATTSGLSVGANGAVSLSNADTCSNSVTVKGPITNAGKLSSEVGVGGHRTLEGNLTNTGTVAINTTTEYDAKAAAISNQGAIDIATGQQLQVSNEGTATNGAGGSIAAIGTGSLLMKSGTSFTEGAGKTSGTLPVIVDDAALTYSASGGESTIASRGEGSTLSGSSSAKQSLIIESTCGEHAKLTAASGFSNGGSITLTNAETCSNNADADRSPAARRSRTPARSPPNRQSAVIARSRATSPTRAPSRSMRTPNTRRRALRSSTKARSTWQKTSRSRSPKKARSPTAAAAASAPRLAVTCS